MIINLSISSIVCGARSLLGEGDIGPSLYYSHSQEVIAKFGYRSKRQVENVRELIICL
jgi:hypothetical protein